jgi:uncharacterized membrane protein
MRGGDRNNRPDIEIEATPLHWVLSALGFGALVASALFVIDAWDSLPGTVYTHFDGAGVADGTGPKATIAIMPSLGFVLWAVLGFAISRPRTFNYPVIITPANAQAQYEIAVNLLQWVRMEVAVLMAYLGWGMVVAVRHGTALPFGSLPMYAGLALTVTVVVGLSKSFRAR